MKTKISAGAFLVALLVVVASLPSWEPGFLAESQSLPVGTPAPLASRALQANSRLGMDPLSVRHDTDLAGDGLAPASIGVPPAQIAASTPIPDATATGVYTVGLDNLVKTSAVSSRYVITNLNQVASASTVHEFYDSMAIKVATVVDSISNGRSQTHNLGAIYGLPDGFTGNVIVSANQLITWAVLPTPSPVFNYLPIIFGPPPPTPTPTPTLAPVFNYLPIIFGPPPPTPTPTPTPVVRSWFWDFNGYDCPWVPGYYNWTTLRCVDGEFEIMLHGATSWTPWSGELAPLLLTGNDYSIEVDARLYEGSTGSYGILFDAHGWSEGYIFLIAPSTGQYAVKFRRVGYDWTTILGWTESASINRGGATNRLRVERNAAGMTLYINGNHLVTQNVAFLPRDEFLVGFGVMASAENLVARFDDYRLVGTEKRYPPGVPASAVSR